MSNDLSTNPNHEPVQNVPHPTNQFVKIPKNIDGKFEEGIPNDYQELTDSEAIRYLKAGKPLEKCYIKHLSLTGEFSKLIQLKQVYIKHLNVHNFSSLLNFNMSSCHIKRTIIDEARFEDVFSAKNCHFQFIHIKQSHFLKNFNVQSSKFNSKVVIQQSIFEGRARFWEAEFKDWFSSIECVFKAKVDLRSAHFDAGFTVPNCHFHDDFLFRGAHLTLKWEGDHARFEKLIDFSKAKLGDFVYLEDIVQGEAQQWAFWNTVSERILVRPDQVEGRIQSEEAGEYYKAMREYAVLKRSFEYENQYSYDDWAFYRFKVNERKARAKNDHSLVRKLMDFADWLLLDWGCGYGTHPLRAIRTALVMIVLFALIYILGFDYLHTPDNIPFPDLKPNALLNQLAVSLFVSLAAFTSGFGDLRDVAIGWMNIPIMIEAILGTLMWGLFIVAFGRKVIR
ncbi:MAG: hypothetical protein CMH49_10025 [Myxococcales bacterium]|nr:hypothetical protein [Myxococcales bacterium]